MKYSMKYLPMSNEIFDETGPTLNENAFHSFVVAKQIFLWQLPQLHRCNWQLLVRADRDEGAQWMGPGSRLVRRPQWEIMDQA